MGGQIVNRCDSVWDCDGREGGASVEGDNFNRHHPNRDGDGSEGGASSEGFTANRHLSVWD
eukprot:CAMPEP_0118656270 /NCGR_PEP_ID=MMETSP0785-20121206/13403_1 /TAXON_ID=91992 /ORGANISM="Bolidomonas pacifica, Strain CCMP 1866" /LENGTH=60 /DNA_ID=CAMNT_0006549125 /DNA_START=233 /DNA_END=415 /DNA_ORIENTATION=+